MTTEHDYSVETLYRYVDREMGSEERRELEEHLTICNRCTRVIDTARHIEKSARALPVERTTSTLTASVMEQLRKLHRVPLAYRVLSHIGYLLGTIAAGILIVSALLLTGVVEYVYPEEGGAFTEALRGVMRVVFAWSAPVIRVIAHDEAFTLSLFIGLAVLLVALLDRMISKVFLRRTR